MSTVDASAAKKAAPNHDITGVLHLIDTYRVGGPGKTIINSARFINPTRYRLHAGAFTHPDPERNEFARAVGEAGIPFLDLPETRRVNVNHVWAIRDYVRRHEIRIVHAHGYRSDLFCYLATRGLPGVSIVTTHHGWIRNNTRQRLVARFAQALCSRFDGVEVVSQRLFEEAPQSLRRQGRVAVVHNGIVLEDYVRRGRREEVRQQLGIGPDARLLGVIGRFSPEKGCLEMLEAFRTVAASHPDVHLLLIGEGPLAAEMQRRLEGEPHRPRVHFVPHQRHVQPYFEALDVLVSPSRTEGISNVILEALTFSVPVVATRVGGTPEIVEDGRDGLLVQAEEPLELARAVGRVLDERPLYRALAEAGRRRVEEAFSFQARMRKEEEWYRRVARK